MACVRVWLKANGAQGFITSLYPDTYRQFTDAERKNSIIIRTPNIDERQWDLLLDWIDANGDRVQKYKVKASVLAQAAAIGGEYEYTGNVPNQFKNAVLEAI
jgi:hypothetical protein